jgi:hypothetical protein
MASLGGAEVQELVARLRLKDEFSGPVKQISRSVGQLDKDVARTGSRAYKAGTQIGTGIKTGVKIAAAGTAAFTAVMIKAVLSASDLNETISKTKVVFGPAADSVLAFGKTAAQSLGLSEQAADEAAATYGNLFVSMGLAPKSAAKMSTALTQLAGDLASFNNVSPEEALQALQSGLVGETEPLRKFGVNLNEQTLKAEALKLGLVKLKKGQKDYTQVLTPAQKAQAAYALIFEQTKTAQGDYARTSSGLANQLRTLRANFSNLAATLGTAVLPQIAKITSILNTELAKPENIESVRHLGEAVAGLFTDENIRTGTNLIKGFIDSAVAAAPILEATAKTTLTIVQAAVSLFKSLPAPLQQLAVGAFAVNKLTGGLVTNVGGAIAGGIAQFLAKQFTGAMNVNAGTVIVNGAVGGGGGGPSPIAAATGGIGIAAAGTAAIGAAIIGGLQAGAADFAGQIAGPVAEAVQKSVGGGPVNIFGPIDRLFSALSGDLRSPLEQISGNTKEIGTYNRTAAGEAAARQVHTDERLEAIKTATAAQNAKADALNASVNKVTAQESIDAALARSKADSIRTATEASRNAIVTKIGAGTAETATVRTAVAAQAAKVDAVRTATEAARNGIMSKIGAGTSETAAVAAAVRAKKLSVTNNISVPVKVSVQNIQKNFYRYKSFYNVPQ